MNANEAVDKVMTKQRESFEQKKKSYLYCTVAKTVTNLQLGKIGMEPMVSWVLHDKMLQKITKT